MKVSGQGQVETVELISASNSIIIIQAYKRIEITIGAFPCYQRKKERTH